MLNKDEWQEEPEPSSPGDDSGCAESSAGQQKIISLHRPIDKDDGWDDVEIELPEVPASAVPSGELAFERQRALRMLVLAALREGRVHEVQIRSALHSDEDDDTDADEQSVAVATLRFVLADSGIIVDDEEDAPVLSLVADETDEDTFGEAASLALARFWSYQSDEAELLTHYLKSLPSDRLSRQDVGQLGRIIEDSMLEVLAVITASTEVVCRVRADTEAILRGKAPLHVMFSGDGYAELEHGENAQEPEEAALTIALPGGIADALQGIADSCQHETTDRSQLAACLYSAGLSEKYLAQLQDIASSCDQTGVTELRLRHALAKAAMARNRLVTANLRLVFWVAKRYGGLTLMDRIQEGTTGLMRAAQRFDYTRGTTFSTYAVWWIRQAISRAVADMTRTIRIPIHVQDNLRKIEKARKKAYAETGKEIDVQRISILTELPERQIHKILGVPEEPLPIDGQLADAIECFPSRDGETVEDIVIAEELRETVHEHLEILETKQRDIIRRRFGIGCDEQTLEEVGKIYGVTRERIRQIEAKALRALGSPGHMKRLRSQLR